MIDVVNVCCYFSEVEYVVTVETGKVMNGGTDAQVTISVFGDKNKFVQHVLDKSDTHRDTFETAQTDVFRFSEVDVGKVCRTYASFGVMIKDKFIVLD